jgi:Tfp pilus assembly major pilin PilA
MHRRQRGMTFIGLLTVLALAGVVVYGGIRLAPVYLNYLKVARAMAATAEEHRGENANPESLRLSLNRHWEIDDTEVVGFKDIEITKEDNGVVMHIAYDHLVPYIGNVSLSVHFDKTVKVQ